MSKILVLDSGGDICKVGWAPQLAYTVIPNYSAYLPGSDQVYIADECHSLEGSSMMQYNRPVENGRIKDWDLQKNVWSRVFSKQEIDAVPSETTLVFLEPPMNTNVRKAMFVSFLTLILFLEIKHYIFVLL